MDEEFDGLDILEYTNNLGGETAQNQGAAEVAQAPQQVSTNASRVNEPASGEAQQPQAPQQVSTNEGANAAIVNEAPALNEFVNDIDFFTENQPQQQSIEQRYAVEEQALASNKLNAVSAEPLEPEVPVAVPEAIQPVAQPSSYSALSDEQLLNLWRVEQNMNARNRIIKEMQTPTRKLFPTNDTAKDLADGGLYPDVEDPNFVARLLKKAEFADTASLPFDPSEDPCSSGPDFEVTPVQRFVANFMHPATPYMSMLLYHGVGVGKTCAAIQAAESYLDVYPRRKAIIVAPVNIQPGFLRTIFDFERLKIGRGDQPNRMSGCTGDTYLKLTGCLYERDIKIIERRVKKAIQRRYEIFGYISFRNYIRSIMAVPQTGTDEETRFRRIEQLKKEFNYRFLIIDEAHNLRDVLGSEVAGVLGANIKEDTEEIDTTGSEEEKKDAQAGKELTPYLKELLKSTDGMKLLLMTATPMFNVVQEILLLLNLMLINDKKAEISMEKILNADGTLAKGADDVLRPLANAYISFMRGENPNSFPIRLLPTENRLSVDSYPAKKLGKVKGELVDVPLDDKEAVVRLPLVVSEPPIASPSDIYMRQRIDEVSYVNYLVINSLLQDGNCIYPAPDDVDIGGRVGSAGFALNFSKKGRSFTAKDARWLSNDVIANYSPKCATILNSIQSAEGVCFMYSRFVLSGALLMALILEANGYTPYGRSDGYLTNGIQSEGGRQCALCPQREEGHGASDHSFTPAKFVLLTGDKDLSPKNAEAIAAARGEKNIDGGIVKVVLGSQIAGEGLDLRFIREVHILDAWFHLNKTEQIIGRAIRFCSHSLIADKEKRNTTVFLHVLKLANYPRETADIQAYRVALQKAVLTGKVSRKLKIYAVDCNLRKDVTVLSGLEKRIQTDSKGQRRTGNDGTGIIVDDMPYSVMCDWMECAYECIPSVDVSLENVNISTYNAFGAKHRITVLERTIRTLFGLQSYYPAEQLLNVLVSTNAPRVAIDMTLQGILNNRLFRIKSGSQEGYITYRNGYFLFQPDVYMDTRIPLALRVADFPIKRDEYSPGTIVKEEPVVTEENEKALAEKAEEEGVEMTQKLDFWHQLTSWLDRVVSGSEQSVGINIKRRIELIISDREKRDVLYDRLSMIVYVSRHVQEKDTFRTCVLEYFWDEWLDEATQRKYLSEHYDEFAQIASENIVGKAIKAFRFVNTETNELEFWCNNGAKKCSLLQISEYESDDTDEVQKRTAFAPGTGGMYGFNVPKAGTMVFKTNAARDPTAKIREQAGEECIIISAASAYMKKLKELSELMTAAGISGEYLIAQRQIFNTKQACAALNLTLRYLDAKRAGGKRWFFRPLAAFYSKHKGRITQEARKLISAAAVEQKKAEKERKIQERAMAADAKKALKKAEKTAAKKKVAPEAAPAPAVMPQPSAAPDAVEKKIKPKFIIRREAKPKDTADK
jgi:hypothetical protein